ncbi:hypothetical protein L210DRAFT_960166 [Boletus edulis BED1]|uniref:GATA-type domain-containing protein n=1 Tax=Boletus edulis BED1 TaxID=1328754 RepID=A0AAD4GKL4_BOLED|nr:hypothetical protein L210DRAFT_960166 [Boletus edulis BED1]
MYHHQQTGSSYDYPSYPTTPFESAAPPAQPSGRPVRSNTSQTHSPQQQPSFQPSPPYASSTTYPSASYSISPAHAQQWQQESWASQQYTQPYTSQSVQAEMTYTSTAPRPDAPVSTPDTRGFPPSLPPPHEPRRQDSGYSQPLPASAHNPSPPRTRRREKDSPAIAPAATSASGPDFAKLQDSYRLIMDNASNMMASGTFPASRSPPVENLDRMLQSANLGSQMLQSAIVQSNPDVRSTTGVGDKDAPASKRQKGEEHAQEGQTCLGCNATSTPEWRRGPLGPRTLCNACGLVYAKLLKKRARGETRVRPGDNAGQSSQNQAEEPNVLSSGGSEDGDSYGSQDRRSDFGDHGRRG